MSYPLRRAAALALLLPLLLAGCGGGGGPAGTPVFRAGDSPGSSGGSTSGGGSNGSTSSSPDPAGPSASFAQQCAANNTLAAGNLRTSTLDTEKKWLRAYFDEAYLWREQVPQVNPSQSAYSGADAHAAMDAYFEALKTTQTTDTGQPRDRFSFTYPTDQWTALTRNAVEAGYGIEWKLTSPLPPRQIQIAYVEAGSPADRAGLRRGDQLISVDSVSADVGDPFGVDALNAALFPDSADAQHDFTFARGGVTLRQRLTSAALTKTPVPISRIVTTPQGTRAGYLLFNDHIAPAEGQLITAMQGFQAQGVRELVLDLRYNGGGYLYIASELATMIAGTARTAGQAFETLKYSARRSAENETTPFYDTSCILVGNNCTQEQPLPTLNLTRVYVLAQSGTCSASEAVINGLRGVGVDVVLIGGKTCGKPYGFTARDNCGISYFPIEFTGVNAQGFGDYADGFEPSASGTAGTRLVKGCSVADDTGRALGDPAEAMLATALGHVDKGSCPVLPSAAAGARVQNSAIGEGAAAMTLKRHPARSNRLLVGR
ncbi:peptidase S41 [Pelomonas sp. Root1217]|uniref:S41 family peptidase n=1 Tax=Pelomonas sp. Root1217 TaxID=1736430 RepID=UPI00070C9D13|nr:S41 family peptidase [Pelomonas sp. Root1217]KQV50745.1 peptidase S41 [Pelomonas sp. Root1217]